MAHETIPGKQFNDGQVADALFSERVQAGNRTYFFDAKRGANGSPYVKITESTWSPKDQSRSRHQLLVFEDSLDRFAEAFGRAFKAIHHRS